MHPYQIAILYSLALFAGLMIFLEFGFRLGRRRAAQPHLMSAHEGIGAIEAAVFGLLGLLLGFSFAGGASRLDTRRDLIVSEANAIGTAYLRLDLLPAEAQPEMRRLFGQYLDTRLQAYRMLPDLKLAQQNFALAEEIQQKIWSNAITASRADSTQNVARVLLPALNDMIDVTTNRAVAMRTHLPGLILNLLVFVALLSGILAGYAMSKREKRSVIHMLIYAAVIALTVYAVADLDHPRSGLIRLEAADNALVKLRQSIR
ncbi:MAG TPA: hypothetical protein VLT90_05985 [Terriglobales bacterium]|nr:hypothetical protein [Terriglobales bacterium]